MSVSTHGSRYQIAIYFSKLLVAGCLVVSTSLPGASAIAAQLTLTWTDASTDETGFKIERALNCGTYTQIAAVGANVSSYVDTGVSDATLYCYRVRAYNAVGDSPYSNVASATTPTSDTSAPATPSSLGATAVSASQVNLTWAGSSDNVAVTGYRVERSQGAGSTSFVQVGTATGTAYTDTGLSASTIYNYRVRATDAAGNLSGYSAVASATTQGVPALPPVLVAAYSFNEGSGTTVADASLNGNVGSIGTATWTASGKHGGALSFNGTSAFVTVNNAASLQLTTAMTLEAWVYPTALGSATWRNVIIKERPGGEVYNLYAHTDSGTPTVYVVRSGSSPDELNGAGALPLNTWTHLAATYDNTTLRLFVNGTQVSSRSLSGALMTSTGALLIGGNTVWGEYFQGSIDDVRIYARALSASEIQSDMNTPVEGTASNTAPTISIQPASQSVAVGGNVTFTVAASGTGPLSYQWRKSGSNIAGATNPIYTIASVEANDAGSYDVVISNVAGSATSSAATLAVNQTPSITTQPVNQIVIAGSNATFAVTATGSGLLSYQWRKDGSNIAGAIHATYTLPKVQASNAGSYDVVVSNMAGSVTSTAATLTVNTSPMITGQPASLTVTTGNGASFTVTVTGTGPLSYQWRKGGSNISGATNPTYALPSAQPTNAGSYDVVVSNMAGSVTSSIATLTVNVATVPPAITTQPNSQTVTEGMNVGFAVAASGTGPLTYQWRKDGIAISSATNAACSLSAVQFGDAGSYDVVVNNEAGSVTSVAATLTVNPAPVAPFLTGQPVGQTVVVGSNVSFTVTATGTAPLTFHWSKDGNTIPGATNETYSLTAAQLSDAGNYDVLVGNAAGAAKSVIAVLTVLEPPVIGVQPTSQTVLLGSNATFSVVASGTAPLQFQWRLNGVALGGATNATLNLPAVQLANAGAYSVVVSNLAGSVLSADAVLTVQEPAEPPPTSSTLAVVIVGAGAVTPDLSGESLEIGKSYTMTAIPSEGNTFSGWSGGVTSSDAMLSFVMQSNLVLQATFSADPALDMAGTYNGLVYDTNSVSAATSGALTLAVGSDGKFRAKMVLGGSRLAFAGQFGPDRKTSLTIARKGASVLTITLESPNNAEVITGTISDGVWTSVLLADRVVYSAKSNPSPYAGQYSLSFSMPDSASAATTAAAAAGTAATVERTAPVVDLGAGLVVVDAGGAVSLKGALTGGRKLKLKAFLSREGIFPLYVPFPDGQGCLLGWVQYANETQASFESEAALVSGDAPGAFETVVIAPPGANMVPRWNNVGFELR